MRKCDDCKLILEDTARFCPKCGKPAEDAADVGFQGKQVTIGRSNALSRIISKPGDKGRFGSVGLNIRRWVRSPGAWAIAVGLAALVAASVSVGRWSASEPAQPRTSTKQRQPLKIQSPQATNTANTSPTQQPQTGSAAPLESQQQPVYDELRTLAESTIKRQTAESQEVVQAGAEVDDVIADPRQKVAVITFSMKGTAPLTKLGILSAAVAIARAAFAANSELDFVTARCVARPAGTASTQIAFVGDTARQTVQVLPDKPDDQQLSAAFGNQWWNPTIR